MKDGANGPSAWCWCNPLLFRASYSYSFRLKHQQQTGSNNKPEFVTPLVVDEFQLQQDMEKCCTIRLLSQTTPNGMQWARPPELIWSRSTFTKSAGSMLFPWWICHLHTRERQNKLMVGVYPLIQSTACSTWWCTQMSCFYLPILQRQCRKMQCLLGTEANFWGDPWPSVHGQVWTQLIALENLMKVVQGLPWKGRRGMLAPDVEQNIQKR